MFALSLQLTFLEGYRFKQNKKYSQAEHLNANMLYSTLSKLLDKAIITKIVQHTISHG